jgi:hypothetical protein
METINYKISGVTATKILSAAKNVGDNPTMTICNINTTACDVSVFYSKENYAVDGSGSAANTTSTFFVLKSFNMPNNKTLTLDKTDMSFNNKGFDLYIQLGASTEEVDVIITI